MDVTVTINYSTDNEEVNTSFNEILAHTLPYMADNIVVRFDVED